MWRKPMSTVMTKSDYGRATDEIYGLIAWIALGIFLIVVGLLVYALVRYRERGPGELPRQIRGHSLLEIGWTIAPALVLLVIAIPTIQTVFRTQPTVEPEGALEVTVRGHQWWWEFSYPALGIVTANELHLPLGRAAALRLEGPDVIHSFWVPQQIGRASCREVCSSRWTPDLARQNKGDRGVVGIYQHACE